MWNPPLIFSGSATGRRWLFYKPFSEMHLCHKIIRKINGLDEQRIMAVTGHRSKDGVRTYKKISRAQEEEASDILQNNCKKAKIADDDKENLPPHVASKPSGLTYNISGCHITINH